MSSILNTYAELRPFVCSHRSSFPRTFLISRTISILFSLFGSQGRILRHANWLILCKKSSEAPAPAVLGCELLLVSALRPVHLTWQAAVSLDRYTEEHSVLAWLPSAPFTSRPRIEQEKQGFYHCQSRSKLLFFLSLSGCSGGTVS